MKPICWGAIAVLVMVAVAAVPAHSGEVYVAAAIQNGDATYMALNPDGTFSEQQKLMHTIDHSLSGYSFGNGLGDFNNDGQLDYIMALGFLEGYIYIFPKTGPGPQFDPPVWAGSWSYGLYPADIAVADFNGDGNLDFVLNYFPSPHCGLYLGDGAFGFTFTLLENATPYPSMGIDAADFNNDEIADFVVAPRSNGDIYVQLGNPDGTFTRVTVDRTDNARVAVGIAAGNFIEDGDGFVDLAVSSTRMLEVYRGNGDGTFVLEYVWKIPVNFSSLDNGDFNRDGHQDLVAADYDTTVGGVAVLLGNGQGEFFEDHIYTGESKLNRRAVTALPYLPNKAPVIQLTPESIEVTVGDTVEWDASKSYDEDGFIVRYEWDFGDGAVALRAADGAGEPQASYVYYDSGTYTVTLRVTDDQGASSTVQAVVKAKPIEARAVRFSPRKLDLKSKGKWMTATIWLKDGYTASMIDPNSLVLEDQNIPGHMSKRNRKGSKLKVKFDRQALIDAIGDTTGPIDLTVSGAINGYEFSGNGTIVAFGKQKRSAFQKDLWKEIMSWFSKGKSKHK